MIHEDWSHHNAQRLTRAALLTFRTSARSLAFCLEGHFKPKRTLTGMELSISLTSVRSSRFSPNSKTISHAARCLAPP